MKKHTAARRVLIVLAVVLILCAAGFFIYVSDYYHADAAAQTALQNDPTVETRDNLTILPAAAPSDTALIFYPGAKVEAAAYVPILQQIRDKCGITCILVAMPFNLAVLDVNAADGVVAQFPEVRHWVIAGHSMGGAMASDYASRHTDTMEALILMGAYIYGDYPPERALTIYGTFNADLEKDIHYTDNIVKIEGGNHAQFGNYGKQAGDPDATISAAAQQAAAVDAIRDFLAMRIP